LLRALREKATKDEVGSKDSYSPLRYLSEDSAKAMKQGEPISPESVVAAFGEGPDL